jgi:nitrous oxidase accessory protein NosD
VRGADEDGIGISTRARDVTVAGNDVQGSAENALTLEDGATDVTVEGKDVTDNKLGTLILDSTGTRILSNDISRSGDTGIAIFGPERANNVGKVVDNRISGGPWGIYVERAHGGSFTGNQVHDNCAGMVFETYKSHPVGGFALTSNTVTDNTRSCRAQKFGQNFSGIGIALLDANGMEVTANHLSGNVPSGPTHFSGGVVVATDPYGGTQKPKDNTVAANHFGRNKPDIFYDGSGSGNQFRANYCDTSVPSRLCK